MANRRSTLPSYVLHVYGDEPLRMTLDDFRYFAEPGVPMEVPEGPYYAEKLVELYGPVYGLIHVAGHRTSTGYQIDTDAAQDAAQTRLDEVEEELVLRWVKDQHEDRLKGGLPALPPSGRTLEIIKDKKIDIKARFGFSPVGWENGTQSTVGSHAQLDPEKEELRRQLAALQSQLQQPKVDDRLAKMEALLQKHLGISLGELEEEDANKGTGK